MKTAKELPTHATVVYTCELTHCPICGGPLERCNYQSGRKTVQLLESALRVRHQPKRCGDPRDAGCRLPLPSAAWRHLAPPHCTYGYEVIAHLGWQRQTHRHQFGAIQAALAPQVQISEAEVRHLYYERYLPLLACHERQYLAQLRATAAAAGLLLSLDGLAPEGGEPQLWVVRELRTGLTLRSGWLSSQDHTAFEHLLQPVADLDLRVAAVLSDKERGLVPAVRTVFPGVPHAFCQVHYLDNLATPIAQADEALKVTLRQTVRAAVGEQLREEHVAQPGVLTMTGLLPSPVTSVPVGAGALAARIAAPAAALAPSETAPVPADSPVPTEVPPVPVADPTPALATDPVTAQRDAIVTDLQRRVRYLLTLKGRPPFRLAGLEMSARLTEVHECLTILLAHHAEARLLALQQGLAQGLAAVAAERARLSQAAAWLQQIEKVLDPADQPPRTGAQVHHQLTRCLADIQVQSQDQPTLATFVAHLEQTTQSYAPGLFHSYDIPDLPRTNNDRESEFRDFTRRLLMTTGQQGATRRLMQRSGAWELIPHPTSVAATVSALAHVEPAEFQQERERVRTHRRRFRLHTRSAPQAQKQLQRLQERWLSLPGSDPPV
jgi:hypothetical protein